MCVCVGGGGGEWGAAGGSALFRRAQVPLNRPPLPPLPRPALPAAYRSGRWLAHAATSRPPLEPPWMARRPGAVQPSATSFSAHA